MLKAIVAHNEPTRNPSPSSDSFSQLTPTEIDERNAWSDEHFGPVTNAEIEEMAAQEQAYRKRLYQAARAKFDTLHVFSQPDSLTRRGEMLILRRKVTVWQAHNGVIDDWKETLVDLFERGVTFCDASIDRKYNLRIWFLLDVCYGIQQPDAIPCDDEPDQPPHNAADINQEVAP